MINVYEKKSLSLIKSFTGSGSNTKLRGPIIIDEGTLESKIYFSGLEGDLYGISILRIMLSLNQ